MRTSNAEKKHPSPRESGSPERSVGVPVEGNLDASQDIQKILDSALDEKALRREDSLRLLSVDVNSNDCDAIMAAANRLTHRLTDSRGTIYSQVGINIWPCPENCNFCYLGGKHGIVTSRYEMSPGEVVEKAVDFERDGADEIYLMTTANYPVERFIEIGQEVRRALEPETELIANIGDFELPTAYRVLDSGFTGVYHVYRFREGIDTDIEPERRRATFRAIKEAGLDLRYCIEPVGPEHSDEEIVDQMMLARRFGAKILSVMRRIPVPGTPHQWSGELAELEIARIVAVARLTLGRQIRQMGVHEPSLVSLRAGAHRICAEVGMNPRDLKIDTATGRGLSVKDCENLLRDAGFHHSHRQASPVPSLIAPA